ncbi:MAG: hypothetical protein DMG89_23330 [Acidobacteria bacterium]|nr:MAG: hypothetical protein DMG89_23330 [Acidobacteriota bacterium]
MKPVFLLVLSLFGLTSMRATGEANFCLMTSQAALRSCRAKARSDLWLAFGKCDNVADAAKRRNCKEHASATLKDALSECGDQYSVRQSACQRLGPEPYDPIIDPANFVDRIDNPYFPLTPGTVYIYEGQIQDGLERDEFFVTHKTVKILGVTTVEVHDTVTVDGQLTEDTLDWFAQDKDGNVWYFGENTMELENGRPSTLAGTFKAGVNHAKPGIVMEAHPAIGDFYRQEFDLGNAEDFAEVKSLSDTVTVPVGTFTQCLRTLETTPLEPDLKEAKWYATGIGNVLTKDLNTGEKSKLVRIEFR